MHFRGDYLKAKAKEFKELIASIKPDALFAGHALSESYPGGEHGQHDQRVQAGVC